MQKAGFKDARPLLGGLAAWENAGGKTVKSEEKPKPEEKKPEGKKG